MGTMRTDRLLRMVEVARLRLVRDRHLQILDHLSEHWQDCRDIVGMVSVSGNAAYPVLQGCGQRRLCRLGMFADEW
jgi:hypothetical protein